jgi:hypothetical protein
VQRYGNSGVSIGDLDAETIARYQHAHADAGAEYLIGLWTRLPTASNNRFMMRLR